MISCKHRTLCHLYRSIYHRHWCGWIAYHAYHAFQPEASDSHMFSMRRADWPQAKDSHKNRIVTANFRMEISACNEFHFVQKIKRGRAKYHKVASWKSLADCSTSALALSRKQRQGTANLLHIFLSVEQHHADAHSHIGTDTLSTVDGHLALY